MTQHFLLHGSLRPTNLEKNLNPCIIPMIQITSIKIVKTKINGGSYMSAPLVANRGSYMSVHVLLILLNELEKR